VFKDFRYIPNRLVYKTILDTYYRDHEHPPYWPLAGHGYIYLGSIIEDLKKYDLYLYLCGGEEPLLAINTSSSKNIVLGELGSLHPALQEVQKRAEASGLLSDVLF
jgi:hypothetical protein